MWKGKWRGKGLPKEGDTLSNEDEAAFCERKRPTNARELSNSSQRIVSPSFAAASIPPQNCQTCLWNCRARHCFRRCFRHCFRRPVPPSLLPVFPPPLLPPRSASASAATSAAQFRRCFRRPFRLYSFSAFPLPLSPLPLPISLFISISVSAFHLQLSLLCFPSGKINSRQAQIGL